MIDVLFDAVCIWKSRGARYGAKLSKTNFFGSFLVELGDWFEKYIFRSTKRWKYGIESTEHSYCHYGGIQLLCIQSDICEYKLDFDGEWGVI